MILLGRECTFRDGAENAETPLRSCANERKAPKAAKTARFTLGLAMLAFFVSACDGEARFTTEATLVHVGRTLRPVPWPDTLRHRIEAMIEETP